MKFYNREEELTILQENERQAESHAMFTVLMGRRRVGKTSLITHAFEGKEYAYLFVSRDNEAVLCGKFQQTLAEQIGLHIYGSVTRFRDLFEAVMLESQHRHFTVVIDEFQNLYRINPAIFGEMQDLWDRHHRTSRLNFIVCGSIQSLMKRIFEDSGEPLYGRPTSKFTLYPFRIATLKEILRDHNPGYSNEDLLCLYMITGGVAKYVELLMDANCTTKEKMLNYVCRRDSYFLTEGRDLLAQEFSDDHNTYYSILQLIARGKTRRSDIDGTLQRDAGVYLLNLERNFNMIRRLQPLLAKPSSKTTSYEIADPFLRFWFRFICPYQALIEQQQFALLRRHLAEGYEHFSGRTLEQYFQTQAIENGRYTRIGNWWDRKGENEIDLLALNEFDHTGLAAEVKRNPSKIDLAALERKVHALPSPFAHYSLTLRGLSLEDM